MMISVPVIIALAGVMMVAGATFQHVGAIGDIHIHLPTWPKHWPNHSDDNNDNNDQGPNSQDNGGGGDDNSGDNGGG